MLRALRFVLNINYRQLSINYFINFFFVNYSLMFIHVLFDKLTFITKSSSRTS